MDGVQDKSSRRYASAVERALSLFDTTLQEWADYISFLGRLLKVLQARPTGATDIPHKAVVAKRLSQCLNPTLPSGVHQKTLEVYAYIFSVLKKDGLARDLPLYLPGLSPTLSFASLSVKPALLSLFETFFLTLDPKVLRPALKAIVLALLPGLDEETSEEFDRTLNILTRLKVVTGAGGKTSLHSLDASGDQYFWQCFFLASITSPSRRQGALAYLVRNLPRLGPVLDIDEASGRLNGDNARNANEQELFGAIQAIASPEPGLLIRCFAAGLQDEQMLVQRGFLDLLVTHLPLRSPVLHQKVSPEDLERLVAAAVSVVARRDMSLNRRLWTWFLGPELASDIRDSMPNSPTSPESNEIVTSLRNLKDTQVAHFKRHGLSPLVQSIRRMIDNDNGTPLEKARPFRICLSLMDRWEIGGLVVPRVFLPAMESAWRYQKSAPSKDAFTEVLRSASVFFDGVESGLIWGEIMKVLVSSFDVSKGDHDAETAQGRLSLVLFIITRFNVREEEMLIAHIPMVTLVLLATVQLYLKASTRDDAKSTELARSALKIASQLLDLIPERAFAQNGSSVSGVEYSDLTIRHLVDEAQQFYSESRNIDSSHPPITGSTIAGSLLHITIQLVIEGLHSGVHLAYMDFELSIIDKLVGKIPKNASNETSFSTLVEAAIAFAAQLTEAVPFPAIAVIVSALDILCTTMPSVTADNRIRKIVPNLINRIWADLSPSIPKYNVEAVRCIWRIHSTICPDSHLVESSVATLMSIAPDGANRSGLEVESARRFATLWAHTSQKESLMLARPLLIFLDSLFDSKTEVFLFASSWLQSLSGIQTIVDFLVRRLQSLSCLIQLMPSVLSDSEQPHSDPQEYDRDLGECLYYLQTISNLIQYAPKTIWPSLSKGYSSASTVVRQGNIQTPTDVTSSTSMNDQSRSTTNQTYLAHVCVGILDKKYQQQHDGSPHASVLRQAATFLLQQMFLGPSSADTMDMNLEVPIIEALSWSVKQPDTLLQVPLMSLILTALRTRATTIDMAPKPAHRRILSGDTMKSLPRISLSTDRSDKEQAVAFPSPPPPALLDCVMLALSSQSSHSVIEHWIRFLDDCMPLYARSAFQILMPLVDCFNKIIYTVFESLQATFEEPKCTSSAVTEPIATVMSLLNGLEQALARAHDILIENETNTASVMSPEQTPGFFGNMVSGVFAPDTNRSRTATANNRLTVLLCFKDAVQLCFEIWSWDNHYSSNPLRDTSASASFNHTSMRVRNRSRRILEHLFAAEALECLETLIELWYNPGARGGEGRSDAVLNLLHVLDGSKPKNTIPAIFNAMYSRTNPTVLDPARKSTLTSDLSDINLSGFLVAYTRSLEDDAMDEIWSDCMTFLRDVLANPMPHRQILPRLLEFTAILGQKVDNTNFGEQRKMRRELGDLFSRLLSATFTIKPLGFTLDTPPVDSESSSTPSLKPTDIRKPSVAVDIITILASIVPNLPKIVIDTDRIAAATTIISIQVITPTIRWKTYPQNVTEGTLSILFALSRIPEASKIWKKDVTEAFNDPRFFCASSLSLAEQGWLPILRQWTLIDKDRMPEYLSRLSTPTSAGIMFGVGASSARLEADRKTQLNLRRMATLILAAAGDAFVVNVTGIQEKVVEILTATAASSPSSITRAEVFMLLRALILKTSTVHLASFWPIISSELYDAISSLLPDHDNHTYNAYSVVQACKLLDMLLNTAPDDFQLREWLFITDTIDAVYRPATWTPAALIDRLAEDLGSKAQVRPGARPSLASIHAKDMSKNDLVSALLPYLRQLSINSFESTYRMEAPDWKGCYDDLLVDLFDDSTLV